jgi:hypothetical protein
MGRGLLIALFAAVLLGALAVSGTARTLRGGTPAPAAFRLSDGSAGCAFDGARLACATTSPRSGVVLEADESSRPTSAAVVWDDSTPVLRRTESWWHGGFSCRVEVRLVCEHGNGSISVGDDGVGGASSAVSP